MPQNLKKTLNKLKLENEKDSLQEQKLRNKLKFLKEKVKKLNYIIQESNNLSQIYKKGEQDNKSNENLNEMVQDNSLGSNQNNNLDHLEVPNISHLDENDINNIKEIEGIMQILNE